MGYHGNAMKLDIVSGYFGTEVITFGGDGKGQGADQECREVTIIPEIAEGPAETVYIGTDSGVDTAYPKIPDTGITLSVENTNLLHFYSNDVFTVSLIWRS